MSHVFRIFVTLESLKVPSGCFVCVLLPACLFSLLTRHPERGRPGENGPDPVRGGHALVAPLVRARDPAVVHRREVQGTVGQKAPGKLQKKITDGKCLINWFVMHFIWTWTTFKFFRHGRRTLCPPPPKKNQIY